MATVDDILDRLGGMAQVARELGCPLTTVQGWKDANYVPDWRRGGLLSLAMDKGTSLSTDDFPSVSERRSRARGSMSGAFTPEQEARIAEIVGRVLAALETYRGKVLAEDADTAAAWVAKELGEAGRA